MENNLNAIHQSKIVCLGSKKVAIDEKYSMSILSLTTRLQIFQIKRISNYPALLFQEIITIKHIKTRLKITQCLKEVVKVMKK